MSILLRSALGILQMEQAILIHSPHSGRAAHLEQALSLLRQHNVAILDVVSIADLDGLPPQGPVWKAWGLDGVIAAGGDGLVGGVITHIAASGLPLGIMPLGRANDIARTLHIPHDIQQATKTIVNGHLIGMDVGVAQPAEQAPHHACRHSGIPSQAQVALNRQSFFAHVLTVGLNVQFARLATNITIRQRFGRLTYPIAALEVLKNYKPIELDIEVDGLVLPTRAEAVTKTSAQQTRPIIITEPVRFHCKTLQVTVVNAPIFGGQWQIALPKASVHDHLLDIVIITDIKLETLISGSVQFLGNLNLTTNSRSEWHSAHAIHPLLQQAELSGIQGVYHFQAQGAVIRSNVDPQDVTLDGEIRGQTPLKTHIAPQPLYVIVPASE
jgi:diacylglycerol kinase (ATP)